MKICVNAYACLVAARIDAGVGVVPVAFRVPPQAKQRWAKIRRWMIEIESFRELRNNGIPQRISSIALV
jgi:hypothetical protein